MDLASGWFAGRPAQAGPQIQAAIELGFRSVSLLPGDPPLQPGGLSSSTGRELGALSERKPDAIGAAAWDALHPWTARREAAAVASGQSALQELNFRRISKVLTALRRLGGSCLVVAAGLDERPAPQGRGRKLLARLQAGGAPKLEEESMETLGQWALGRENQWECLARFLFQLRSQAPGLAIAIAADPSPAGLLDLACAERLLRDPALSGIGLWLDSGVLQIRQSLGLEDVGKWLDRHAASILGMSLQDYAEGQDLLAPGEGQVDFPLIAEYLPRSARKVLSLAPSYPGEAVIEARRALGAWGIA
ncbi:MAG: hypothetical protein DWQ01_03490 [Planctomycetota bacterium]|nr:MAG: hypothetical protein DWQ01_03490 [Planctomycetota bacterium]